MKILLALTAAIFAASLPASAYGYYGDEWLGIEGLRIADVHHTEGYLLGIMNLSADRVPPWPAPGPRASEAAGVWTVTLVGEAPRRLDLTLYQAEGQIFGEGTMTTGVGLQQVAAAGEVTYNQLDLRCVVLGEPVLVRLWIGLSTSPAGGRYAVYAPGALLGTGEARGSWAGPPGGASSPLHPGGVLPPPSSRGPASGVGAWP